MRVVRSVDPSAPNLAVDVSGRLEGQTPVVLIHGMGGDHTTWRPAAKVLRAAGRPTIAVDLRGHGRSEHADSYLLDDFSRDIERVVQELGLDRFDLVGHSLGAHAALRYAMGSPDRVRRLVLEEVPPMPRDDADLAEQIAPSATLGERVRGLRALAANPGPFLRFDRALPATVTGQFDVPDRLWWERLGAVDAPTLVISGGARSFLPGRLLETVAEALPDGRFVTIDAGHSVHRDARPEFLSALSRHVDG
ncbi:alpha/beta hydrolase [Gordonia sp. (in: high G+C Gram-positive bacteria)]|uniref:alpha/beta fold hydrolase n=1 Tax=Gordonia sp. (in: high G+C Gram-positive bacteria) TaxID=84139 RepID=UPI0016AF853B|nr:alpha/beta hydrolase [Gordonia sp. (in: high G+C Gram-positive bacteria)]NLG48128.1 alpha/beta hydrolase [Gordonia sp. (in: high G+C Gram-positive bacteria)]